MFAESSRLNATNSFCKSQKAAERDGQPHPSRRRLQTLAHLHIPTLLRFLDEAKTLAFPRPRRHKSPARKYNNPARSAPLLFTSLSSLLTQKIPAEAGIFIAFILPNKRQIRRQSERQHRLQSPKRRYRRARGAYLSGLQPRRICPWAYVPESFRFSESASRRDS